MSATSNGSVVVPALKFSQGGFVYYMAVVTSEILSRFPVFRINPNLGDTDKRQGYQRDLNRNRVEKILKYFSRVTGTICPAVLANDGKGTSKFTPYTVTEYAGDILFGLLEFHPDSVNLLDGQHRQAGTSPLVGYNIPVMIGTDTDKYVESEKFVVVNSEAKSVSKDVINQNSLANAKENGWDWVDADDKKGRVMAQGIVTTLNRNKDSVWYHGFVMPGQSKLKKAEAREGVKERYSTVNSFSLSLQKMGVLNTAFGNSIFDFDDVNVDKQIKIMAEVVNAFWSAVAQQLPACFKNPIEYGLQNAVGAYIMHMTLNRCFTVAASQNVTNYANPAVFRSILKGIPCFQPANTDWWNLKSGKIGTCGSSQKAAKKVYKQHIEKYLKIKAPA